MKKLALAFLFYAACTALFFWPTFMHITTRLIGPPEDNMQFFWFVWYGSESLWRPEWPFLHSTMIYYPEGVSLLYANYFYFGVFVSAVLHFFFSYVTLFNLFVLASFVLSGLGTYLLARDVTGDETVSLIAGFIFAFNPSHFAHALHHVTIASIQFIPWFMLYYFRAMKTNRIGNAVYAALFIVLSALCDWNYLVYIFIFIAFHQFFGILRERKIRKQAFLSAALFVAAVIVLLPLIWPMIQEGQGKEFAVNTIGPRKSVADLLGFIVPNTTHLLSALPVVQSVNGSYDWTPWEKAVYLGWANLVLLAFAWRALDKHFLFTMLGFMILSLGSTLHFYGKDLGWPLPNMVIEHIPFFKNARNPSRSIVFSYLFLSLLVAQSLVYLKVKKRWTQGALLAVFLLIFSDYYALATQTTPVVMPPAYDVLKKETDKDFAIINLPWDGGRFMMYQTIHGIPDVQGYVGRKALPSLINKLPYTNRWEMQKRMLIDNKVKYLFLHKWRIYEDPASTSEVFKKAMEPYVAIYSRLYKKVYEDDKIAVFKIY